MNDMNNLNQEEEKELKRKILKNVDAVLGYQKDTYDDGKIYVTMSDDYRVTISTNDDVVFYHEYVPGGHNRSNIKPGEWIDYFLSLAAKEEEEEELKIGEMMDDMDSIDKLPFDTDDKKIVLEYLAHMVLQMLRKIEPDCWDHCKSGDPLTFKGGDKYKGYDVFSYLFFGSGRHHRFKSLKDIEEAIKDELVEDVCLTIEETENRS